MEMGRVGMRSKGGIGVGTFFGTAFFGAGGVVEIEEDDVELVELVDEGGRGGCCAMMLGMRRARNRRECSLQSTLSRLDVGAKPHGARTKNVKKEEGKITCGLSRKSSTRSCMVSQGEVQGHT